MERVCPYCVHLEVSSLYDFVYISDSGATWMVEIISSVIVVLSGFTSG